MSGNPNQTQYDVTVNADGVYAGLAKASSAYDKFAVTVDEKAKRAKISQDAISEALKVTGDTALRSQRGVKAFMDSLQQEAANAGKTRAELLSLRAAQLGVADSARQYIEQIERARKVGSGPIGSGGISDAQRQNAMRMVPAQFTDIVTQLQGGANPLTVLTQQGGQLKDMFGGVKEAAKGMGTYVLGLINPMTVGIGAVVAVTAALGIAMSQGAKQSERLSTALALTGNFAGKTSYDMIRMADALSNISGSGAAFDAMNAVVSSGKASGEAVEAATRAIIDYGKATGKSADDSAQALVPLFDNPATGAAKLNESMHMLTLEQFKQIQAMQDAGDKAGAMKLAFDAVDAQTRTHTENVGLLQGAYRGLAASLREAWRELQAVGRAETNGELLNAAKQELANANQLRNTYVQSAGGREKLASLEKKVADAQARVDGEVAQQKKKSLQDQIAQDGIAAEQSRVSILSNGDKRAKAAKDAASKFAATVKAINSNSAISPGERAQMIKDAEFIQKQTVAAANEHFKDPKGAKAKKPVEAAATDAMLESIKRQNEALETQVATREKLTAAEKVQLDARMKIAAIEATDPKRRSAEDKRNLADKDRILATAARGVELQKQADAIEAQNKLRDRTKSIEADILTYQKQQSEQYAAQLDAVGRGQKEQQRVAAERAIRNKYLQEQAKLDKETPDNLRGGGTYKDAMRQIAEAQQKSLDMSRDYYAQLDELQGNWVTGFKQAWADYADSAANNIQNAGTVFRDVTNGLEQGFAQFCETGKLNFASMTKSILADLAKIAMQKAIMGFGTAILNFGMGALASNTGAAASIANALPGDSLDNMVNVTGGFGTALAHAAGGHITGPGSGTSDSIPAWLSNGEYVLTAETVRRIGVGNLDKLNSGAAVHNTAHFATGGAVGSSVASTVARSTSGASVNIEFHGDNGGLDKSDTAYLGKAIKAIVDQRIAQKMKGQGGYAWQMNNGVLK